jgi:hypothetical protein
MHKTESEKDITVHDINFMYNITGNSFRLESFFSAWAGFQWTKPPMGGDPAVARAARAFLASCSSIFFRMASASSVLAFLALIALGGRAQF